VTCCFVVHRGSRTKADDGSPKEIARRFGISPLADLIELEYGGVSKYPPAEPGALGYEPLKAAVGGR
jgi:hypothetical protein